MKLEWRDLRDMGATPEQIKTYNETEPLDIYHVGPNLFRMSGVLECETDAQGVFDMLDALSDPDC